MMLDDDATAATYTATLDRGRSASSVVATEVDRIEHIILNNTFRQRSATAGYDKHRHHQQRLPHEAEDFDRNRRTQAASSSSNMLILAFALSLLLATTCLIAVSLVVHFETSSSSSPSSSSAAAASLSTAPPPPSARPDAIRKNKKARPPLNRPITWRQQRRRDYMMLVSGIMLQFIAARIKEYVSPPTSMKDILEIADDDDDDDAHARPNLWKNAINKRTQTLSHRYHHPSPPPAPPSLSSSANIMSVSSSGIISFFRDIGSQALAQPLLLPLLQSWLSFNVSNSTILETFTLHHTSESAEEAFGWSIPSSDTIIEHNGNDLEISEWSLKHLSAKMGVLGEGIIPDDMLRFHSPIAAHIFGPTMARVNVDVGNRQASIGRVSIPFRVSSGSDMRNDVENALNMRESDDQRHRRFRIADNRLWTSFIEIVFRFTWKRFITDSALDSMVENVFPTSGWSSFFASYTAANMTKATLFVDRLKRVLKVSDNLILPRLQLIDTSSSSSNFMRLRFDNAHIGGGDGCDDRVRLSVATAPFIGTDTADEQCILRVSAGRSSASADVFIRFEDDAQQTQYPISLSVIGNVQASIAARADLHPCGSDGCLYNNVDPDVVDAADETEYPQLLMDNNNEEEEEETAMLKETVVQPSSTALDERDKKRSLWTVLIRKLLLFFLSSEPLWKFFISTINSLLSEYMPEQNYIRIQHFSSMAEFGMFANDPSTLPSIRLHHDRPAPVNTHDLVYDIGFSWTPRGTSVTAMLNNCSSEYQMSTCPTMSLQVKLRAVHGRLRLTFNRDSIFPPDDEPPADVYMPKIQLVNRINPDWDITVVNGGYVVRGLCAIANTDFGKDKINDIIHTWILPYVQHDACVIDRDGGHNDDDDDDDDDPAQHHPIV